MTVRRQSRPMLPYRPGPHTIQLGAFFRVGDRAAVLDAGESEQPFVAAPWITTGELGEGQTRPLCCDPHFEFFKSCIASCNLSFVPGIIARRAVDHSTIEHQVQCNIGFGVFIPIAGIAVAPGAAMVTAKPPAGVDVSLRRDEALAGILAGPTSASAGHRAEICADLVCALTSSCGVRRGELDVGFFTIVGFYRVGQYFARCRVLLACSWAISKRAPASPAGVIR